MQHLEQLRNQLPEAAKDIRLNLQTVFQASSLTPRRLGASHSRRPSPRANLH